MMLEEIEMFMSRVCVASLSYRAGRGRHKNQSRVGELAYHVCM